ncbi:MAG: hypothetical protein Q4B01_06230 [Eubacteriales bacterium]|nr:hypothetical protein [Eubacteriales bacterium]
MEYGKLYTILLSTVVSEKQSSVNQQIAKYILDNLSHPEEISVKNISANCHVGNATISRFCREIGLQDFFELKDLISDCKYQAEYHEAQDFRTRVRGYRDSIAVGVNMVMDSVKEQEILELCREIHDCKKVAVFGWLKSEAAAWVLQMELAALGKNVYTAISHRQQMEYLKQADEDDLIVILSYRGIYFEYFSDPELHNYMKKPRICFVTGSEEAVPAGADRILRFHSDFSQNSHPYQLLFFCNIISREYARLYRKN